MKINVTINKVPREVYADPTQRLQPFLKRLGLLSVRNSDDAAGYAGSDTILLDGKLAYANLLLVGQVIGHEITTAEYLSAGGRLSLVQQCMLDVGVVQSAYNSPATALVLTELLERKPDASRQDVIDALGGMLNRAMGYEQFFQVVDLAKERIKDPTFTTQLAPEFRPDLRLVGTAKQKVDGVKLIAGHRAFVEDMVEPGACILKMLRSPHAHALITDIDTTKAEEMPGVVQVITYKNCPDKMYTSAGQGFPEPSPYDKRMFSKKLYHVGDRVAAVVAETEEIALKAIKAIEVEYEVLQPIFTVDQAMAKDAPVLHGGPIEYVVGAPDDLKKLNKKANKQEDPTIFQFPLHGNPHKNIAASVTGGIGDIKKGLKEADVVLERTYETSQVQCTPMEPHIVYTKMDGDRLVIHAATQVPYHLRRIVSTLLDLPENRVRVIKERVGGGYGSKQDILLEEVAAFATYTTGRPVLFRYTREEEFIACSTRKPMRVTVKLGAKKDGTLTGVYMQVEANTGPFGNHALTVPMNACSKSLPLVLCDNFKFDVTTYYTNIPPTGAYQGYGAPKGSYALMTGLAELAEELGIDYYELMEKNRVREGVMLEILRCLGEGREGTPALVKSCGLDGAMTKGAEIIKWGEKEVSDNPNVAIGKGFALIQQGSGLPGLDHSCATMKMAADGTFILHSGGSDLGTGLDTVCAKVAAEVLKTELTDVHVYSGDTDVVPFDTGAYASSGTYFSGNAAVKVAENMRELVLEAGAAMLGVPADDCELVYPSRVQVKATGKGAGKTDPAGTTKKSVSFLDIARDTQAGLGSGQLMANASYTTEDAAFPYGAHFCKVAVDKETGDVKILQYIALQDCGTPINPDLALGQIYGGVLKSIGHSMYEEMILDKKGRCLNANFADYLVPTIGEIPEDFRAELIFTEDPFGPFGGKSISEIATNGAAPALAIAIHDAVGVWIRSWPFTQEKVLQAMEKI